MGIRVVIVKEGVYDEHKNPFRTWWLKSPDAHRLFWDTVEAKADLVYIRSDFFKKKGYMVNFTAYKQDKSMTKEIIDDFMAS